MVSYQILGIPYENLDDMIHTMALMASLPVLIGASIFYLTPGCPIAREFPDMTEADVFKARSTAMANETERFRRDDLYTLFVTARIINFLKGLCFGTEVLTLKEALRAARGKGLRENIGAELLERLLSENGLYAFTRQGLKPLNHFRTDLFFRVMEKTARLCTTRGQWITLI